MKTTLRLLTLFMAVTLFCSTSYAANTNDTKKLIVKAHHEDDMNTVIRIWKTNKNKYIVRTSYDKIGEDFEQSVLEQYNKDVKWDGFSKSIIFNMSSETNWTLTHRNNEYFMVFNAYSNALKSVITVNYVIDYIDKQLFNDI